MDETHFVINFGNGRTLVFRGDSDVKYADVVSGGGMTMMVNLTGGPNSQIATPMLIFQNAKRSYPIQGLPDDVPGVTYRAGPKGCFFRLGLTSNVRTVPFLMAASFSSTWTTVVGIIGPHS
ncbi:hypothetical protein PsorP6_000227 [Peronosclerospora sorghi]|uniref:Uncharacterized protein n=1 Tax=Peronosclerospora sorghi TaxID=230839 RepID=A0ACC0WTX7_9STRA|nr:hypothetical protein PsorP6_000227 [Peronosclerospora sorghi]